MCGIFFSCSPVDHQPPSHALLENLKRRGPDGVESVSSTVTSETTASHKSISKPQKRICFLTFLSTVLSLRGSSIAKQPLRDSESNSILCWNGEAWGIKNKPIQGNDAEHVFKILLNATKRPGDKIDDMRTCCDHSLQGVIDILSSIYGPYAFIFHDAQHHRVFYGRDVLGRRSLLAKRCSDAGLVLSSICDPSEPEGWMEVGADGIYVIDLTADVNQISHVPWVVDPPDSMLSRTLVPQSQSSFGLYVRLIHFSALPFQSLTQR